MERMRVCRICLHMDTKLYHMQNAPWLESYLGAIVGTNALSDVSDLPPFACVECAFLLKKYYNFRERCLIGQSILYGIINTHGQIEELKQFDRNQLNLASPLCTHHIPDEAIINIVYEEKERAMKEIKFEPQEVNIEVDGDGNFMVKSDYNEFELPDLGPMSSDDDEPLSLHKEKKIKEKKKVKKEKRKKEEQLDDNYLIDETDIKPELSELEDIINTRKKRGRPRTKLKQESKKPRRTDNTGGVVDDYVDIQDYVTVIKLTEAEQIEEIQKRKESSNYLNAAYQCNLCYKGFIDTHAWEHHVGKHDPSSGDVECPICKFRFETKRALQKHAANHEKKYACRSCPYVSKTTTQAKQHQRWHKGVTYKCQHCDEISTKWTSYLSHVRIKHPSEFICGVCGYSFVSKLGLTMHKTMMHKDVAESLESSETAPYCESCDVKFISVEAYKRHMVTSVKHTQSRKDFGNGCRVCGETFTTCEELRVHHRRAHARKRPKNYGKKPNDMTWPAVCPHCSEEIPNAREYWTHFRRMHPDKNYPIQKNHVCDICGKSFRGNAFLVYHKRTHFEERAYKCAQCPKAFFNRTNLQMHEKTHSDSRPYPCNVCFKAFKCKGALDRHYRSHTGVKPYECELCGKAFAQSNSRKLHVRTVHLKQPTPYVSRSRMERRKPSIMSPETSLANMTPVSGASLANMTPASANLALSRPLVLANFTASNKLFDQRCTDLQ